MLSIFVSLNRSNKTAKATNLIIMKYLFILFMGLFTASAANAEIVTREVQLKAQFSTLEVSHDIDVVLTESTDATIRIAGEEKFANAVLLDQKNGEVRILSKKGSMRKRVTVYVPVQNLRNLIIKGASYVRSNGILASNKLQVTLSGASKVELNNIGELLFAADEGIDILVHKWQTTQNNR
jgi:hypothetical protein